MALKATLQNLDGLSEEIKALYKQQDDKTWKLDVEGMVDKAKIDEFRNTNLTLVEQQKELQKQLEQYKGIDPAKWKELKDKMSSLEEKKLLDEGKLDEVFKMRTEALRHEFAAQLDQKDKKIKELEADKGKAYTERDQFIIDAELRRAVDKPDFGFQSGVADLLKPQVLSEFQYKEGKVARVKPDGSFHYGRNGDPESLSEFLETIVKERPYLTKSSNGGGAHPKQPQNLAPGQKSMKRSEFDAIADPAQKMAVVKAGTAILD